ncbi:MAG: DUF4332 domain-containing protein [Planctomycetota bacterium]|nr:DUF4332 domain-containing protein [Planctomycetota bacterium]
MRLVSIDIDPQNRSSRIHLGPFVAGLNAVWGARGAGKSTITRFVRGLLYNRHRDSSGNGQEAVDGLVGSLQWADSAGTSRVVSSADCLSDRDYCLDGPYHFGRQSSLRTDASYPHSQSSEQPWHRIGSEIYDAVFCGRLGETLPERLWQAARELGIHIATGHQHDETYRRLKAEQHRLEQRLHHLRVDDRDRAWWATERDRLVCRAEEIRLHPERHLLPAAGRGPSLAAVTSGVYGGYSSVSGSPAYRDLESQLVALRAEASELDARFADLSRAILEHRRSPESTGYSSGSPTISESQQSSGRYVRSNATENDHYGSWVGYSKHRVAPKQFSSSLADLHREQEVVAARKLELVALIEELQSKMHLDRTKLGQNATAAWELEEIQQRVLYAEEVLKSWDLYETTRRRLAEVQQQLRGNGPYHDATQGAFLQTVERYVRELSAGSLRHLPSWAMEALRRDLGFAAGLAKQGRPESYREVYRDYRPDLSRMDHAVPASQSSERQLVELAIRMAICDSAAHRIGRLPLILDDALDGFHGATLDHLIRVLIEFAREGQQVLLMTSESEVAQRVRGHHGWVAQLNSPIVNVAAPTVSTDSFIQPARTTFAPAAINAPMYYDPAYVDINAQLSAAAESSAGILFEGAWQEPAPTQFIPQSVYRPREYPTASEDSAWSTSRVAVASTNANATLFLSPRSPIEDAPNMMMPSARGQASLATGLRSMGIRSVGSFLNVDPVAIANSLASLGVTAEEIADRQAEQKLMCTIPNLRSFDARILVGCGVHDAADLAAIPRGRLLKTVERFLTTPRGQNILRSGSNFEVSRMTTWLASAGRTVSRHRFNSESTQRPSSRRKRLRALKQSGERHSPQIEQPTRERTQERPSERTRIVSSVPAAKTVASSKKSTLQFYLDLTSPIVDAPSIGPRVAEQLNAIGIQTVNDFLRANATTVAMQLEEKRITAATIVDWQNQATLVCRIPNLRGHDAQQLVAAGITTAEQLASSNVSSLVNKVVTFASSKLGQRVLRGAAAADEVEVRDWIRWATSSRTLRAA